MQGTTHTWHVPQSPGIQAEEGRAVDAKDTVYLPAAQDGTPESRVHLPGAGVLGTPSVLRMLRGLYPIFLAACYIMLTLICPAARSF